MTKKQMNKIVKDSLDITLEGGIDLKRKGEN